MSQDEGYLYMVMDFVKNSDLKQMLKLMSMFLVMDRETRAENCTILRS